jgi:hypothetical protein
MDSFIKHRTAGRRPAFWLVVLGIAGLVLPIIAYAGGRLLPNGPVTLYQEDKAIGTYTQEAPLPEGAFLRSGQRCAVLLHDLYLVAEANTLFAVDTSGNQRNLTVRDGIIYFKTGDMRRPLNFITPAGQVNVHQIHLNAASGDASIKGYVAVHQDRIELGVAEGGSMVVSTDQGVMTVSTGSRIILAQAHMDLGLSEEDEPEAEPTPPPPAGWTQGQKIAAGAIGAGAVAGILLGLGGGGGGGGGGGSLSPSTP